MRKAGEIVAGALALSREMIRPGVSTGEIDHEVERYIRGRGAIPVFKGYRGHFSAPPYPASICASINEEVVHGIPSLKRFLKEGDILSVDVGVRHERFVADAAYTFPVGTVSAAAQALLDCCKGSLIQLLPQVRPGMSLYELGGIIQRYVEARGFSVVRDYVGHGVGRELHEDPQIPHYACESKRKTILKEGMTLAVEPMVNQGTYETEKLADEWTVVTRDRKLSAHFEHTFAVTKEGALVLTGWPE